MFALGYRNVDVTAVDVTRAYNRASIALHYPSLYYVTRIQVKTKQPKYDKNVSLPMNVYLLTHFLLSIMASDLLTSHMKVKTVLLIMASCRLVKCHIAIHVCIGTC